MTSYAGLRMYEVRSLKPIWFIPSTSIEEEGLFRTDVFALAFLPNGRTGISVTGNMQFWDSETGRRTRELRNRQCGYISKLAVDPHGAIAVTGEITFGVDIPSSSAIALWDLENYQCIGVLEELDNALWSIDFSSDGRLFAAATGKQVYIWETATQQRVHALQGAFAARFSPRRDVLATFRPDASITPGVILWDPITYEPIRRLDGGAYPFPLAFSPNGQLLAMGSYEQNDDSQNYGIQIWSVADSQLLQTVGVSYYVEKLSFSPDGYFLLSVTMRESYESLAKVEITLWGIK